MAARFSRQILFSGRRLFSDSARVAYDQALAAEAKHAEGTSSLWKKISLFGAIPTILFVAYNTYVTEMDHIAHHERLEFHPYEHLRIRKVRFPWGDGNHSIFHGHNNALPDGYEH